MADRSDTTARSPSARGIAAEVEMLADSILRAAGSGLKHYTDYSRRRILSAAMDGYEAAYRAGAERVLRSLPTGGDDE